MDLKILGVTHNSGEDGCVFPVMDPDGKRRRLCGEETRILDGNGNKRAFCVKHAQLLTEYLAHRKIERLRGDKTHRKKIAIRKAHLHPNVL